MNVISVSVRIGLNVNVTPMSSVEQMLQVVNPIDACVGGVECVAGVGQQFLSGFRKAHVVAVACEQLRVHLLFELPYLLRQRALRYEQSLCGFGEVECFGCLYEVFQLS